MPQRGFSHLLRNCSASTPLQHRLPKEGEIKNGGKRKGDSAPGLSDSARERPTAFPAETSRVTWRNLAGESVSHVVNYIGLPIEGYLW